MAVSDSARSNPFRISASAWRWGLGSWAALALTSVAAAFASTELLSPGTTVSVPGYEAPQLSGIGRTIAGSWLRADALWYLRIAESGYGPEPATYAFFPLFPMLVRAVSVAGGIDSLFAGLAVANVACALGLCLLFCFVERLFGVRAAKVAVAGLAVFPTSFFLIAPYAEGLLIATGVAALVAAVRGRMGFATFAGLLAGLTRPFGVLLALPLAAIGWSKGGPRRGGWAAGAGPIAGAFGWAGWVAVAEGDPMLVFRVQRIWQRDLTSPVSTLVEGFVELGRWWGTSLGPYFLMDAAATLFGGGLVAAWILAARRGGLPPVLVWGIALYGLLVLVAPLAAPFRPRPLLSVPRFLLALAPLFAGYGLIPRGWSLAAGALSAALLAWAGALFVAARPIF